MGSHSHSLSDKRKMREALESKYGKMSDAKYSRLYESWKRRERLKDDPNYDNDNRYSTQKKPVSADLVRKIYGDEFLYSGDLEMTPPKKYESQSHYKHKPIDHDLTSVMDQIRNGTGRYKKSKPKLGQDYLTREMMRRRDLPSESSGGIGIGFIMAFIGVAVFLVIAILIFSEISDEMLGQQYMNATSNYPTDSSIPTTVDGLTELLSDNLTLVMLLVVPFFILLIVRQIL